MAKAKNARSGETGQFLAEPGLAWQGAEVTVRGVSLPPGASTARVRTVMTSAGRSGLLGKKDGRIGGRLSADLIARAKANTGITTDTELLEFALASVALEDRFAEAFEAVGATVDPDLKLGF